ncbi:hypothetical protein [Kitasatospora griseola]
MTWFAVGDTTDDHPKILAAGNAAVGLWVRCGAYASAHLTDGLIPAALAAKNGTATQIAKLLAAGLWHVAGHHCGTCPQPGDGEYVMHGYLEANPSRRQVEERRQRAAAKKRRQRDNEPDSESDPESNPEPAHGEHPGQQGASPGDRRGPRACPAPALPSRREGAGVGGGGAGGWGAARRHPLPDNFAPDTAGLAWAAAEGHVERLGGPDGLAVVTEAFADWHRGRATLGADWQALWRKWVREQRELPGAARSGRRGPGRRGASDAAGVSVAERFAAIEDEIAHDREPAPESRPLTLVPAARSGGRPPRSAAPMPGQRPLMAALPGGRAPEQPDPVTVLMAIADHGQAHAVAEFGWRAVAALLAADSPQAGEG